jgi:hypothetical protein
LRFASRAPPGVWPRVTRLFVPLVPPSAQRAFGSSRSMPATGDHYGRSPVVVQEKSHSPSEMGRSRNFGIPEQGLVNRRLVLFSVLELGSEYCVSSLFFVRVREGLQLVFCHAKLQSS